MSIRLASPPSISTDSLRGAVDWALVTRRSTRAFLPTPVPRTDVEAILDVARYCASGVNTQPWHVHVLMGAAKQRLSEAIMQIHDDPSLAATLDEPYDYYPQEWISPYIDRRRKVGWDLYGLLGIQKSDKERMHAQHGCNYSFFGAPVGLMFTIDRGMGRGSLIDYGMFLQSIMVAARARGLDTCPQAAFTTFHRVISRELAIPEQQMFVCGMSLGYADPSRIENSLVTDREVVSSFTTFHETTYKETEQ
ncbi:nitroreductase [Polaromonas sp. JS666]|uniref:nitroreductase n=1 Tax=Polaromonas sp. (strain JS666 / ATCC BAA-500) TaxID=296591 RepID=UPI000053353C|nr:nitroreductase [Polaromonas sp. JS666]ABE42640.1 nitroreductase [Polaromonas sp. JS666]